MKFIELTKPTDTFLYNCHVCYNESFVVIHARLKDSQHYVDFADYTFFDGVSNEPLNITKYLKIKELNGEYTSLKNYIMKYSFNYAKCIIIDIHHLVDLKILDIYIQGVKLVNLTIRPLLSKHEYILPNIFKVTDTPIKKVLLLGQCNATVYQSKNPENKFISEFIQPRKMEFTTVLEDAYNCDVGLALIPMFSIITDIKGYNDFVANTYNDEFWQEWEAICKTNIEIFFDNVELYVNKIKKITFCSNFIIPHVIPELDLVSSNKIINFLQKLNEYIYSYILAKKNIYMHFLDLEKISCIFGKYLLLDDITHDTFHNRMIDADLTNSREETYYYYREDIQKNKINNNIEPIPSFFIGNTLTNIYGHFPFFEFRKCVLAKLEQQLRIINQTDIVELIIFDLDYTLISGTLVEVLNGDTRLIIRDWSVGILQALNTLKSRGVLLALCTKNDESMIKNYIETRNHIQLNMFTIIKANFKSKSENIREILSELHLTAKSAAFISGDLDEQQEVKTMIPDLRVVPYNRHSLKRDLLWSPETQRVDVNSVNYNKFINSLNIQIDVQTIKDITDISLLNKVHELINKTNQFNTTGVCREYDEFCEFIKNNTVIYFSVKDKTQDYGIVGTMLFNKQTDTIEQFIMSCKVIGLDVENYVLKWFLSRSDTPKTVKAKLIKTELNSPCQQFYEKNNFVLTEDTWCFITT